MANEDFKHFLVHQMQAGASHLLNILLDNQSDQNGTIQNSCRADLLRVSSAALNNERWALTDHIKVFDSNGKSQSGLMSGSLFNILGNYDQCLDSTLAQGDGSQQMNTKYCRALVDLSPEASGLAALTGLPKTLFTPIGGQAAKLGLCVPASCNSSDLLTIYKHAPFIIPPSVSVQDIECSDHHQQQQFGFEFMMFMAMILLLVGTCIRGTIIDSSSKRRQKVDIDWLLRAFSLSRAHKRMTAKRKASLSALDGLRVISLIWTIIMHSYDFSFHWLSYDNANQVHNKYKSFWIQWLANGTYSVDNFFLISGLLAWLKHPSSRHSSSEPETRIAKAAGEISKSGDILLQLKRTLHSIGLRYLRLVPTMMFLIIFSVTVLPQMAYGPAWPSATMMFDRWCRPNWPLNLLLIHNLFKTQTMCFSHSWYVAVDFQLFVLLQIALLLLHRYFALINKWLLILAILAAQACTATIVYVKQLPSIPLLPATDSSLTGSIIDYYGWLYIKPYYWLSSYLLGVLLAECLLQQSAARQSTAVGRGHHQMTRTTNRLHTAATQLLPPTLISLLLLSSWPYFLGKIQLSKLQSVVFSLISRPLWSLCMATILYHAIRLPVAKKLRSARSISEPLMTTKIMASMLNSKIWLIPSRLSYSAFLLHPVVIAIFYGSRTESFQFSHLLLLYFTLGNITLSYLGALFIYLFIESPICVLIEHVKKQQPTTSNANSNN